MSFAQHKLDVGNFEGFQANIEVEKGARCVERKRVLKPHILNEVRPIIKQLEKEGIICEADMQSNFCSNILAVSKPEKGRLIMGKADEYLMTQRGEPGNHQRVCVDLRNLNKHTLGDNKINLPSYKELLKKFSNCHLSQIELCSMYFSITSNTLPRT